MNDRTSSRSARSGAAPDGQVLPVKLQTEYTSYLWGALPLCVVLGVDRTAWFYERYVELFALTEPDVNGAIFVDFFDSQSYEDILDTTAISTNDALRFANLSDFVIDAINDGWYTIAFLDVPRLTNERSEPFVHEMLLYGYDKDADTFLAIGFLRSRFARFTFLRSVLDVAFGHALRLVMSDGFPSESTLSPRNITHPVQLLRPINSYAEFSPDRFHRRLRSYAVSESDRFEDVISSGPWWSGGAATAPEECESAIGAATYSALLAHFESREASPQPALRYSDFRAIHTFTEHKRALVRRSRHLQATYSWARSLHPLTDRLSGVVSIFEEARFLALFAMREPQHPFPFAAFSANVRMAEKQEAEAVVGILTALDRR